MQATRRSICTSISPTHPTTRRSSFPVSIRTGGAGGRLYTRRRMEFELSPEQREIRALARDFAEAEIEPHASQWDRDHSFPRELFGKLGELGLLGVCIPEELGGAGADFLSYILVLEEISRADAGIGVTIAVHTSAATLPILSHGTDEQRGELV